MRETFLPVDQYTIRSGGVDGGAIVLEVKRRAVYAACPECGHVSRRVHSRRYRSIRDVPLGSRPVRLRLMVRRFFCIHSPCRRTTFTEPFP
ncbi:MAG: transposase family protein, partial [Bacillota bacterium]